MILSLNYDFYYQWYTTKKFCEKMLMQFGPTQLLLIYTSRRRMNKESYRKLQNSLIELISWFVTKPIFEVLFVKRYFKILDKRCQNHLWFSVKLEQEKSYVKLREHGGNFARSAVAVENYYKTRSHWKISVKSTL